MVVRCNGSVGLIASSVAIAYNGKKHADENPHVQYGTEALLMMERGEVVATDTHLNEEGPSGTCWSETP